MRPAAIAGIDVLGGTIRQDTFVSVFCLPSCDIILASKGEFMDVVNAISCVFLFIASGPFLEKLFLTSVSPNCSSPASQADPEAPHPTR